MPRSIQVQRRAYTLTELLFSAAMLLLLGLLLLPAMKQRWNASGLDESLNNVRQLLRACGEYRLDHDERVPMRASEYLNGQIQGGWNTWSFAGKNCSDFWRTGYSGVYDEHAHWRFLNPYIQDQPAPVPSGSINTGSGSTWTFKKGTLTPAQRAAYAVKMCRSPGDAATRQRNWPLATPGMSCYNDVGTSYMINMKWWDQPGAPSGNFTNRYNAGTEGIRRTPGNRWYRPTTNFVWIHDQNADLVASGTSPNPIPGEFGGDDMSVLGYLDGRAAYVAVTRGELSGPGYTFAITWP